MQNIVIISLIVGVILLLILIRFSVSLIKWINLCDGDKVSVIKDDSIRGVLINKGVITDICDNHIIVTYKNKYKSEKITFNDYIKQKINIEKIKD
jgi:hypothetical protein